MNAYSGDNSIIVMDNARIHHNNKLIELLERLECHVVFLSFYFSNFNSIKTAFLTVKLWIRRNCDFMKAYNPIYALLVVLLVTCSQITP